MECPKCRHENPEDAKFCSECGHKLELACPKCGKVNPSGSKFCNGCGHDLRKPADSPVMDLNQPQSYTPKHLADKILTTRGSIEGERKSEKAGFALVSALCWSALGHVCAMLGDSENGRRHAEKGLKIHRETGIEMYLSMAHSQLGRIYLEPGDLKNALSLAEEALRLSQKNNEKHVEGWSWLLPGAILGKSMPLQIHHAWTANDESFIMKEKFFNGGFPSDYVSWPCSSGKW